MARAQVLELDLDSNPNTLFICLNIYYFFLTVFLMSKNENSNIYLIEELKSLLIKVKEESEKAALKLSIQKTKIMISSPITSWQIDGETMESVTDFIFLGSKITEDGCLLLERKDKPRQHIKKQRRYFTDKDPSSQSYDFSRSHVWM